MIVFEVHMNGRRLCRAGARDLAVLTAIVTAAGKLGPQSHGTRAGVTNPYIDLRVGGMTGRSSDLGKASKDTHLDWMHKRLEIGDEVCVRLIDSTVVDRPESRSVESISPAKKQFDWAKAHYFANRSKYEKRAKRQRKSN
jgi:hypothetical protein